MLVVLCRPLLARDLFTEPASIKELATELVVSEAAVKQHLVNLYAKFEIGDGTSPRTRLANEAIHRGAVTLADLRRRRGAVARRRRWLGRWSSLGAQLLVDRDHPPVGVDDGGVPRLQRMDEVGPQRSRREPRASLMS